MECAGIAKRRRRFTSKFSIKSGVALRLPPPSIFCRLLRGLHCYWLFDPGAYLRPRLYAFARSAGSAHPVSFAPSPHSPKGRGVVLTKSLTRLRPSLYSAHWTDGLEVPALSKDNYTSGREFERLIIKNRRAGPLVFGPSCASVLTERVCLPVLGRTEMFCGLHSYLIEVVFNARRLRLTE